MIAPAVCFPITRLASDFFSIHIEFSNDLLHNPIGSGI